MSPEMKYCNPVNLTVKQHSLLLSARQCEQGEPNHEVSVRQIILPDCLVGVYHYMHTRVFIRTSHTTLQGSITLHDLLCYSRLAGSVFHEFQPQFGHY